MFESALVGHLVGDFIFQNDFQAKNKTTSTWHCLLHVVLYTLAIMLFTGWYDWRHLAAVAVPHFFIDRFRLSRRLMRLVGQEEFATGPLSPWSIIIVDQVMHLVCLYLTVRIL